MPEYRVLKRFDDGSRPARADDRAHLAELDTNRSLCGAITFDGTPFDEWQIVHGTSDVPLGPEDVTGARCLNCWMKWEKEHRADREKRGLWNPPEPTYKRTPARKVSPQVRSQQIAQKSAARRKACEPAADLIRLTKWELIELGTPEALAELKRRREKRAKKRAARLAAAA